MSWRISAPGLEDALFVSVSGNQIDEEQWKSSPSTNTYKSPDGRFADGHSRPERTGPLLPLVAIAAREAFLKRPVVAILPVATLC